MKMRPGDTAQIRDLYTVGGADRLTWPCPMPHT